MASMPVDVVDSVRSTLVLVIRKVVHDDVFIHVVLQEINVGDVEVLVGDSCN